MRFAPEATRRLAKKRVEEVAKGVCRTFGASAEVEFEKDAYPVTINDLKTTERVVSVLRRIPGTRVRRVEAMLGGEDFSRFLQKAPGTFYFLGSRNPEKGCVHPNHSSRFKADEDVLKFGAASLAMLAFEFGRPRGPSRER